MQIEDSDVELIPLRYPGGLTGLAIMNIGTATETQILQTFESFGLVFKVQINLFADDQTPYAIVTYFSELSARKACERGQAIHVGDGPPCGGCRTKLLEQTELGRMGVLLPLEAAVNVMNHYLGFDGWASKVQDSQIDPDCGIAQATVRVKLRDGQSLFDTATVGIQGSGVDDFGNAKKKACTQALRRCLARLMIARAPGRTPEVFILETLPAGAERFDSTI